MNLDFNTFGNNKQKECASAWLDPIISDIVYGGAKGGAKSYTGASLIFSDALTYPGTYYFIARKKLNDLRKFTLPSIYEVLSNWGLDSSYYKFNGQDNYFDINNPGKIKSKIFLLEAAYSPSDPLYTRFGSMQMTRGWIEEAGEFEEAAKNNLAASIGRWKNDEYNLPPKLLQTCNPAKNYLYREYYRKHKDGKLEDWKCFIQAFPYDNKKLDAGYLENLERVLSKNEKERLLKGNWEYDDDPAALIDYDKIIDIFTNSSLSGGAKRITCDLARLGGDKIVKMEWDGWRGKVTWCSKQPLDKTTEWLEESRDKMEISKNDIVVDEDGIGGGVVDFYKCRGFVNNSKAVPSPNGPRDKNGKPIPENFDNLKSQCYFRLADRISNGGVYIECKDPEIKQMIIEELEQVKQKALDSDLRKGVLPKDQIKAIIGRSPDFADTMMMRELFELKPTINWLPR